VWHNVALQAGRDEMKWGQSAFASLFLSGNATPFPAISAGTDTAITFPWLFRFVGPTRLTLLFGDLGGSQDPPHARLAGWHVAIQPWARLEIGVSLLAQMGGNGVGTFRPRLPQPLPVIEPHQPGGPCGYP